MRTRVRPGASLDDILGTMTPKQIDLLAKVEEARLNEKRSLWETRAQVRTALEAGVPARVLSIRLGLSLARIYQMRDESARAEAAGTHP